MLCALFTALTAVCSQISIPMPWGVPVNLALFAVYLAGAMLGAVWGSVSLLAFLALAAFGVPVLAGFQGGPAAVFGPTGGYVIGYLAAALVVGAADHPFRPHPAPPGPEHGAGLRRLLPVRHPVVHDADEDGLFSRRWRSAWSPTCPATWSRSRWPLCWCGALDRRLPDLRR